MFVQLNALVFTFCTDEEPLNPWGLTTESCMCIWLLKMPPNSTWETKVHFILISVLHPLLLIINLRLKNKGSSNET